MSALLRPLLLASAALIPLAASADEPPTPEATAEASTETPRDHRYVLALGYGVTRFHLQNGYRMGMAGPQIGVDYAVGRTYRFSLHGAFIFPLQGRQRELGGASETFNLTSMYKGSRMAYDVTVGVERTFAMGDLRLVAGGGAHLTMLSLTSKEYSPVELINLGLGGFVRLEAPLSDHLFLGGQLNAALDLVDPVHRLAGSNPAVAVAPMSASFVVGARR